MQPISLLTLSRMLSAEAGIYSSYCFVTWCGKQKDWRDSGRRTVTPRAFLRVFFGDRQKNLYSLFSQGFPCRQNSWRAIFTEFMPSSSKVGSYNHNMGLNWILGIQRKVTVNIFFFDCGKVQFTKVFPPTPQTVSVSVFQTGFNSFRTH